MKKILLLISLTSIAAQAMNKNITTDMLKQILPDARWKFTGHTTELPPQQSSYDDAMKFTQAYHEWLDREEQNRKHIIDKYNTEVPANEKTTVYDYSYTWDDSAMMIMAATLYSYQDRFKSQIIAEYTKRKRSEDVCSICKHSSCKGGQDCKDNLTELFGGMSERKIEGENNRRHMGDSLFE